MMRADSADTTNDGATDALDDELFDDLFHGCAFAAYVDQAIADATWPPDLHRTRERAYAYYEAELAAKNARRHNTNS